MSFNSGLHPCIFFDRDGIVNESPGAGYVERVEDFNILPEFIESLRLVSRRGYKAIIVTNQRCISSGIISEETLEAIHDHLRAELAEKGLSLDGIYHCPHSGDHPDRKPAPGMLLRAAREHHLDLKSSWMIGDSVRDVEAGKAAGCKTILIKAGEKSEYADHQLASMRELPRFLKENLCLKPATAAHRARAATRG